MLDLRIDLVDVLDAMVIEVSSSQLVVSRWLVDGSGYFGLVEGPFPTQQGFLHLFYFLENCFFIVFAILLKIRTLFLGNIALGLVGIPLCSFCAIFDQGVLARVHELFAAIVIRRANLNFL